MALTFGPINIGIKAPNAKTTTVVNALTGKPANLTSPIEVLDDGSITFSVAESGFYTIITRDRYQWAKMTVHLAAPAAPTQNNPGVTAHSQLTGLEADDHPQYLTAVRGDARYINVVEFSTGLNTKADIGHTHDDRYVRTINNQAADSSGNIIVDTTPPTHGQLKGLGNDDHPQYLTRERADARYMQSSNMTSMIASRATATHNHDDRYIRSINDVTADSNGNIDIEQGVTDHGALTGLNRDDHPQYLNQARADDRYAQSFEVAQQLSTKADAGHNHDGRYVRTVNGTAVDSNGNISVQTGVTAHRDLSGLDADDHPQYMTQQRSDSRYMQINNVSAAVSGKSDVDHKHDDRYVRSVNGISVDNSGNVTLSIPTPITSHAGLNGLDNDDHPQYLTNARGDARYASVGALTALSGAVTAKADASHTHAHSALTGLGNDDHPQYHTDTRGDARYYTKAQVDAAIANAAPGSSGIASDRNRANHTGTQPASTITGLATVATSGQYSDLSGTVPVTAMSNKRFAMGYAALPGLALGASTNLTITLSRAMPDTNYNVDILPTAALLGGVTFSVVSKTTTQVVIKAQAGLLVSTGNMVTVFATN